MAVLKKGLVQVYTGDGKGKTTAAFGLAWRMLGAGGRVYICQFLKPADQRTGEVRLAAELTNRLTLEQLEQKWDLHQSLLDDNHLRNMRSAIYTKLMKINRLAHEGVFDLMILDELIFCLNKNLACWEDVATIIKTRATHVEMVLTGRGAGQPLIETADLVTEMQSIKHPYQEGIPARKGIEY